MNCLSLLPSASSKLWFFQVMTVVKKSRGLTSPLLHSSQTTGCQVLCHLNDVSGIVQSSAPRLHPNVNNTSKPLKNSTYHPSPLASAACVKAGSVSIKILRG